MLIQFGKTKKNPIPVVSYCILSYPVVSYPILSYPILSYPILPYPTLSYPILSYPILPYPILSYLMPSYRRYPNISISEIRDCHFKLRGDVLIEKLYIYEMICVEAQKTIGYLLKLA
jgi:hypothetical protein